MKQQQKMNEWTRAVYFTWINLKTIVCLKGKFQKDICSYVYMIYYLFKMQNETILNIHTCIFNFTHVCMYKICTCMWYVNTRIHQQIGGLRSYRLYNLYNTATDSIEIKDQKQLLLVIVCQKIGQPR